MKTRRCVVGAIVLFFTLLLVRGAAAQVLNVPRVFVWGSTQPSGAPVPDPFLTHFVHADLSLGETADQIARSAAAIARAGLDSGEIPPGQLVLYFHTFGHQDGDSAAVFFDEFADRIDGLSREQFRDSHGWLDPDDDASAQTYFHPFLLNSRPGNHGNPPALQGYMTAFCEEWRRIQTDAFYPYYDPNLPDPDGLIIDVEVTLQAGSANCVSILDYLAHSTHWWTEEQMPGYPEGTTLASLYAGERAATGNAWPESILDEDAGLVATAGNDKFTPRNRRFMIWYAQVCEHVRDWILEYCCYSVIRSYWPDCNLLGNYNDKRMDGVTDSTGWFVDRDASDQNFIPLSTHPSKQFPRAQMELGYVGSIMLVEDSGRWLALPWQTSGKTDQPSLYRMTDLQWEGDGISFPGHRKPNLYLPGQPAETMEQTWTRVERHTLESIINSGDGQNQDRVAPWIELIGTSFDMPQPASEDDLRPILALLRSKNISHGMIWTDLATDGAAFADGWQRTSQLFKDVYAPRILGYLGWTGTLINGTDDADPSRLEFSLRVDGSDRSADLQADSNPAGTEITELVVQFNGLNCYPTNSYSLPTPCSPSCPSPCDSSALYDYLVNVECSVDRDGATGALYAWDYAGSQWRHVPTVEGDNDYGFYTADHASRRWFRITPEDSTQQFVSVGSCTCLSHGRLRIDPAGLMALKLVHQAPGSYAYPTALTSTYDLVQVVPIVRDGGGGGFAALRATQSDLNYDGQVAQDDLSHFLSNWFSQSPAGDANLDGQIDEEDITYFMSHYVNGN